MPMPSLAHISHEDRMKVADWSTHVDALIQEKHPTGSGEYTAKEFMQEVEDMFKANGWDFKLYLEVGSINAMRANGVKI